MKILVTLFIAILVIPAFSQSMISLDFDTAEFIPGQTVQMTGKVEEGFEGKPVSIEIKDGSSEVIFIRIVTTDANGDFVLTFKIPEFAEPGKFEVVVNMELDGISFSETKIIDGIEGGMTIQDTKESQEVSKFLLFLSIIFVSVVGGLIVIKITNKKNDKLSGDIEYDDSIVENAPIIERFQDMQAKPTSDSVKNDQLDEMIDKKVGMISKLQENKIGDYDKLEFIKKSLIDNDHFNQESNDYLEEKYEEYKKIWQ
ncbi:MAG: hypothetical protein OEQ12_01360 [Nitrosopumilus sp.]|nr:hypothetical protein [Nitrosopumilus sp.]